MFCRRLSFFIWLAKHGPKIVWISHYCFRNVLVFRDRGVTCVPPGSRHSRTCIHAYNMRRYTKKYIVAVRTYLVHVSFFFKGDFFTLGNKNVYVCRTVTFFCATVQHPAPVGHAGFPPWKPGELAPQHDRAMDAAGRGKSGCFTDTHRQAARD